jgi:triacylglycerol lipase
MPTLEKFTFHPAAAGYDAVNAYALAHAAQLAHSSESDIRRTVDAKWDFPKFRFFNKQDTQGYAAANDKMILLAFRGTEVTHLRDWMTDLRIKQVDTPFGAIHTGFKEALDRVWEEVLITFRIFHRGQPIWITGHSLGAALATLAAQRLMAENINFNGLYTFGSPRVGNPAFCEACNKAFAARTFRFVNNNDVVTRVPQRVLGYDHLGTLKYLDHEGKVQDDLSFWEAFLDRVQGRWEDFLSPGTDGINDHPIGRYIECLEKYV